MHKVQSIQAYLHIYIYIYVYIHTQLEPSIKNGFVLHALTLARMLVFSAARWRMTEVCCQQDELLIRKDYGLYIRLDKNNVSFGLSSLFANNLLPQYRSCLTHCKTNLNRIQKRLPVWVTDSGKIDWFPYVIMAKGHFGFVRLLISPSSLNRISERITGCILLKKHFFQIT